MKTTKKLEKLAPGVDLSSTTALARLGELIRGYDDDQEANKAWYHDVLDLIEGSAQHFMVIQDREYLIGLRAGLEIGLEVGLQAGLKAALDRIGEPDDEHVGDDAHRSAPRITPELLRVFQQEARDGQRAASISENNLNRLQGKRGISSAEIEQARAQRDELRERSIALNRRASLAKSGIFMELPTSQGAGQGEAQDNAAQAQQPQAKAASPQDAVRHLQAAFTLGRLSPAPLGKGAGSKVASSGVSSKLSASPHASSTSAMPTTSPATSPDTSPEASPEASDQPGDDTSQEQPAWDYQPNRRKEGKDEVVVLMPERVEAAARSVEELLRRHGNMQKKDVSNALPWCSKPLLKVVYKHLHLKGTVKVKGMTLTWHGR